MNNKWAATATLGCALAVSLAAFSGIGEAQAAKGPWLIRGRAIAVLPDESAQVSILNGDVDISNQVVPELDITYFFDEHWAAELILAVTPHEVKHKPTGIDIGKVWLLPPTVTLQYHFQPDDPDFRPYVGVGVNYTKFFGHSDEGPEIADAHFKDSTGFALQAGFDIPLDDHWTFNVDVKKVWINTKVRLETTAPGPDIRADVDIDPVVVGVGFGYRF
ncbi:MAG: OmpW family outer membrane protein [Micropepsaceae bacterium]